jgi:hypothetical protein
MEMSIMLKEEEEEDEGADEDDNEENDQDGSIDIGNQNNPEASPGE